MLSISGTGYHVRPQTKRAKYILNLTHDYKGLCQWLPLVISYQSEHNMNSGQKICRLRRLALPETSSKKKGHLFCGYINTTVLHSWRECTQCNIGKETDTANGKFPSHCDVFFSDMQTKLRIFKTKTIRYIEMCFIPARRGEGFCITKDKLHYTELLLLTTLKSMATYYSLPYRKLIGTDKRNGEAYCVKTRCYVFNDSQICFS
jgi:hypothetical protein